MPSRTKFRQYMPLHIADWKIDTADLDYEEKGIYMALIMHYWDTKKPLPLELRRIENLLGLTRNSRAKVCGILARFFTETPDGFQQKRVEKELRIAEEKSQKYATNANARWVQRQCNGIPAADAASMRSEGGIGIERRDSESYTSSENNHQRLESGIEVWAREKKSRSPRAGNKKLGTRWDGRPVPDEWIEEARQIRAEAGLTEIDLRVEAASFADYWVGVAGQKGTKNDWRATWRNWARRANGRPASTGQPGRGGSITEGLQYVLDRFDEDSN